MKVPIEDMGNEREGEAGSEGATAAEATASEAAPHEASAEAEREEAEREQGAATLDDEGSADEGRAPADAASDSDETWDEAAMVEAARRAGEAAAEADLQAEAARDAAAHANASADSARDAAEAAKSVREEGGTWTAADDMQVELASLHDELGQARSTAADATARLARLQADWENYRRRTAAERLAERERAAERLVTALLPVLDDMERASAHAAGTADLEEDTAFAQFVSGVDAVHDKMVGVLEREGVEVIDPVGRAFDPLEHQAVGRVEDTEAFADTVAEVFQRGYRLGGKVIRAAMVTVTFGGPVRPSDDPNDPV